MKVEWGFVCDELRSQWQYDEWIKRDKRGLLLRPMIEAERIEFQLHIPPGCRGVVIVALCGGCRCRYIKPAIVPAADVRPLIRMNDDELLAWLDDATGRFFRHISRPLYSGCNRCGSQRDDGYE